MKTLLLIVAICVSAGANAQILFSEDFDGIPGATAGGAGTYAFPQGWFLRNVDNRTPSANTAYVNDAWERREDFGLLNVTDSCAFSNSWYTPAGAADDWMWTPLISALPANCQLTWNAVAYDVSFPDGYEVRVMTSAQGPPTGGTGVIGNQVTNSTVIFSTTAEASAWTPHNVSLNAYAGQAIYIGFRNNSNDKFLLLIDDVVVSVVPAFDAAVSQTNIDEYTITPLSQVAAIGSEGMIENTGSGAITNVSLNVNVFDGGMNNVYSATSAPLGSLAPGAFSNFTVPGFIPTVADLYTVELTANMTEADSDPLNDLATYTVLVSDSVYARDDSNVTGTLGIGALNGGQLGQSFELLNADELTSLSFFIGNSSGNMVGQPLSGGVYATDVSGTPTTLLASTTTMIMDTTSNTLWTLPISGGPLTLPAGNYVCVVNEADSNVTVGTTAGIFTLGKGWIDWPTNPQGGWANPEDFGAQFQVAFVVRANFGVCQPTNTTLTASTCQPSYTSPSGNYVWTTSGVYNDTIYGSAGCDTFYVVNLTMNEISQQLSVTACDSYTSPSGNYVWTSSGVYNDTIVNGMGCDTMVVVDLTIETVDLTVSEASNVITAAQAGGTYQWIDCSNNTPINGETQQSFTATANGNYAVIVGSGSCSDTSACVAITTIGLSENLLNSGIEVFPNPSNGDFSVTILGATDSDLEVELIDATGKVVSASNHKATGTKMVIDVEAAGIESGVYLLQVTSDEKQWTERVVISRK